MKRLQARLGRRFRLESVAYGLLQSGAAVKVFICDGKTRRLRVVFYPGKVKQNV